MIRTGTIAASAPLAEAKGKIFSSGWLIRLTDGFLAWLDRRSERRALLGLSDEALKDIGLTRAAAEEEGQRLL